MNTQAIGPSAQNISFWTGGFDSTFHILRTAIVNRRIIQPIYIDTGERLSTSHEIAAMDRIRIAVAKRFGVDAAARILPTVYDTFDGVGDAADIAKVFHEIDDQYHLGIQYKWLPNYVRDRKLEGVDLGMHWIEQKDELPCHWIKRNSIIQDGTRKIPKDPSDRRIVTLFGRFNFPLLTLTKADMRARATADGLMDVLKHVHFCHNPRSDGSACGRCGPCKTAAREGLADMLPLSTRYLHKLVPVRRFVRRVTGV